MFGGGALGCATSATGRAPTRAGAKGYVRVCFSLDSYLWGSGTCHTLREERERERGRRGREREREKGRGERENEAHCGITDSVH